MLESTLRKKSEEKIAKAYHRGYLFLFAAFTLQFLAWLYMNMRYGGALGNVFFYQMRLVDLWSTSIERALLTVFFLCLPLLYKESFKHLFLLYVIPFLAAPVYNKFAFSDPFHGYEWIAAGARWTLPLSLFFLSMNPNRKSDWANFLLRLGIAMTFLGHGLKCVDGYPEFADYLFAFLNDILMMDLGEKTVFSILSIIGYVDILVAALCLTVKRKEIFYYLMFWGFLTALYRIVYMGLDGVAPFLLRSAHYVIPLYLVRYSNIAENTLIKIPDVDTGRILNRSQNEN